MIVLLTALACAPGAAYALHEGHYAAGWIVMVAGVLLALAYKPLSQVEDDDDGMTT